MLSLQLIMGVLQLLDFFRVMHYPLIQRRLAPRYFELGFSLVVPMVVLMLGWAAANFLYGRFGVLFASVSLVFCFFSVEFGVSVSSLFMCLAGVVYLGDRGGFAASFFWVLSFFLGLGVVHWGVFRPLGVGSPLVGVAGLLYNVHHVLRRAFPVLLLPFLLFWVVRPVVGLRFRLPEVEVDEGGLDRVSVVLLVFSLYLSVFAAVYPYLSTVNPGDVDFGIDLPNYEKYILRLGSEGSSVFLGSTRTFFYVVLFFFRFVTGFDLHSSLRFLPVLLNPFFVAGAYYFAYEFYRNHGFASWCAFLTSTGVAVTSAMSAYYLTNVLALGLVLFSLGLLFRAVRGGGFGVLVGAGVLGVLLVYTHPWTMDQYLAGLVPLLGLVVYRRGAGYRWVALCLGVYLGFVGLGEVSKVFVFGGVGGLEASSAVTGGLGNFERIVVDALTAFPLTLKGTLGNIVLVALAAVGVYVFEVRGVSGRYLYFLVLLSSVVYFVSNQSRKMRLVINVPFGFFAALVVYTLYERRSYPFIVFTVFYSLFYMLLTIGSLVW